MGGQVQSIRPKTEPKKASLVLGHIQQCKNRTIFTCQSRPPDVCQEYRLKERLRAFVSTQMAPRHFSRCRQLGVPAAGPPADVSQQEVEGTVPDLGGPGAFR